MLAGPGAHRIASLWATSDLPVVSFMMTHWLTGHWLRTRGKPAPADLFGWTSDPQKRICFAQNALETSWIERRWSLHRSCTPVLFLSPEKVFSDIDQNSFQIFPDILGFSNDFWNFSIFEQFYVFVFFQVCFWQLRKKLEFRCRIIWAFDLWGSPPYLCPTNACLGVSTRGFDFELFQNDVFLMIFVTFHDFDIEFGSNSNPVRIILLLFTLGLNFVFFRNNNIWLEIVPKMSPNGLLSPEIHWFEVGDVVWWNYKTWNLGIFGESPQSSPCDGCPRSIPGSRPGTWPGEPITKIIKWTVLRAQTELSGPPGI